ncbi:TPA: hypothetical protein PJH77_005117, partial [Raoultella ornithinolytica]|nr:hypothetical protein [Raoultella ornithinolytica]
RFFDVDPIDKLLITYQREENEFKTNSPEFYKEDNDGKRLYRKILAFMQDRKISEEEFVMKLYEILDEHVDFTSLHENLTRGLNKYD